MTKPGRAHVAFLLSALLPGLAGAQTTPPPDRKGAVQTSADITVVEIPVYVAGSDGRPVRGLTKADFELWDEGKKATDWDLEVIDLEDFSRQTVAPDVPLPPAAQRHFFFLFDLTFAQALNIAKARHAAVEFVESMMKKGDLGAVATIDVEKGLKFVLAFTPDRDQLVTALSTLALPRVISPTSDPLALTVFDPSLSASSAGPDFGASQATGQSLRDSEWADILYTFAKRNERNDDAYVAGKITAMSKELSGLAKMLASIHGRKNVVYFSEGPDVKLVSGITGPMSGRVEGDKIISGEHWNVDPENRYGRSDLRMALDEMFRIFKRSDCVIYPVDVAGLAPMVTASVEGSTSTDRRSSVERLGSRGRGQDSLYLFAAATGGELFKNSNDLKEHLEKLQEQTALVYLVTYSPADLKEPGKFHTLKVKAKAPGAQVSFRAGYYEPRPWSKLTPIERRLLAAQQITYGLPRTDVPSRAIATPLPVADRDGARVPVILEIPGSSLVKQAIGDSMNLEIYAYATNEKLKTKGFLSQAIALDLKRIGPQLASSGIKYYGEMFLPPGDYWMRVLVRIAETGRSGLQILPVTVPDHESRRLFAVGPIFHDTPGKWLMVKAPPRSGAPPPPSYPFVSRGESFIPTADPVLEGSGESRLSVFVYNAPADGDLDLRGEIRGKNGTRLGPAALSRIAASRDGSGPLNLLCSFRPEKIERGSYSLWVSVRDRASGAEGETVGFFEVR